MDVVFETRFSYFGQSGWKSAAAADPKLLFDPPRMDERLKLFERVTLPSLKAQDAGTDEEAAAAREDGVD